MKNQDEKSQTDVEPEVVEFVPEPLDELQTAIAARDKFEDQWLRAQAELDNFRKRTQREAQQSLQYQSLSLIRDLLPGLDNLERAMTAAETAANVDDLLEGVKMVSKQFQDVLTRFSVKPIAAVGEPFDPNLHEAVQQLPSAEHPPMTVLNEIERGYQLHDRVVRPTKVIVSSAPPEAAEEG